VIRVAECADRFISGTFSDILDEDLSGLQALSPTLVTGQLVGWGAFREFFMHFGARVGVAILMCCSSVSLAVAETKPADDSLKIASAATAAKNAETTGSAAASKAPVTRTVKPARKKPKAVAPSLVARIDLNAQRMHVTSNGQTVGSWAISSGKFGYETPPGRFRPQWATKMHYSRKYYNSPMPYSVFFNRGIATHGTAYSRLLGRPASHGCIRLQTANARKFYTLVKRHGYKRTRIIVTGRAKQTMTASRSRRVLRRRNSFAASSSSGWGPTAYSGQRTSRRRRSLRQYDRARLQRHRQRVQRYYRSRRMVFPGDG
jgi:lipoprotein-anchoring transpeptidase ErfK/SrfK